MKPKTYNTPKRKCVVKTRLTEDERKTFEDKCAALEAGMNGHIAKPVDPQLLFRQIARFCGKRP